MENVETEVVEVPGEEAARAPVDQFLAQLVVTLNSKQITIPVKTIEETSEFGEIVGEILGEAFAKIERPTEGELSKKQMYGAVFGVLLGKAVPMLKKMLFAYHPPLKTAGGSEREIIKAALAVLRGAYPLYQEVLGVVLEMIGVSGTNLKALATKDHSGRR